MLPFSSLFRSLFAFGFFTATVHAHHLWIEQDETSAKLYFGEFSNNLREASPGLLDRFVEPMATLISPTGEQKLTVLKTPTAFALGTKVAPGQSIIAQETKMPVRERKDGDKVIRTASNPAARFIADFSAQSPKLPLDIVPTGQGNATKGYQFSLTFEGKPLAKAKVEIAAASGWGRTLVTDEEGKFTAGFPWVGSYVIEAQHSEQTTGERNGAKFDSSSFTTALSFTISSGLTPPNAPEAMKPH